MQTKTIMISAAMAAVCGSAFAGFGIPSAASIGPKATLACGGNSVEVAATEAPDIIKNLKNGNKDIPFCEKNEKICEAVIAALPKFDCEVK